MAEETTTTFEEDVQAKVTSYLDGESVSSGLLSMLTDFAIEQFKDKRNYPSTYTDTEIETDMRKKINLIAMGVVECINKIGTESNTAFSENGISRSYQEGIISYFNDIVPIAHVRSFR